jgi:hypothetical protein
MGLYSAEAIEMRRAVRELNRQGRKLAETIKQPSACSRPAVALGALNVSQGRSTDSSVEKAADF